MTAVSFAHTIRLTYCGATDIKPSRWRATWEGWPSQGARTIGRYLPYQEKETAGLAAAEMLIAWLSDMPGDDNPLRFTVESVTMGRLSSDSYVVLVKTKTHAREEQKA